MKNYDAKKPERIPILPKKPDAKALETARQTRLLFGDALKPSLPPPIPVARIVNKEPKPVSQAKITEAFNVRETLPMIMTGDSSEILAADVQSFESMNGSIEGAAATSMAGYKYEEGKDGKPKMTNQDRLVLDDTTGTYAVVDGMGGGENGELFADELANNIAQHPEDITQAIKTTQATISSNPDITSRDGACFLSTRVKVGEPIEVNQAGDVDLYHLSANGDVKFQPGDHMGVRQVPQSAFDYLDKLSNIPPGRKKLELIPKAVDQLFEMSGIDKSHEDASRILQRVIIGTKPYVEENNIFFQTFRKAVVNAITAKGGSALSFETPSVVESGDWIIIMSDGVSDNFREGQILTALRKGIERGMSPEEIIKDLSRELNRRIELKAKNDPEAERNNYKLDNASIIVMRAK